MIVSDILQPMFLTSQVRFGKNNKVSVIREFQGMASGKTRAFKLYCIKKKPTYSRNSLIYKLNVLHIRDISS